MSILTHTRLRNHVRLGTFGSDIDSLLDQVSGSSIDIRLGRKILIERHAVRPRIVDYRSRQQLEMYEVELGEDGYILEPGEFILAHSMEVLDIPGTASALLRSKSSMGRIGFEHADAGWIDPGFHGALTFEFCNITRYHAIRIRPGDAVGQLILFEHSHVGQDHLYSNRGRYGGSNTVEQTRPHPKDVTLPPDF
jgi:dCTP deaminase